MLHQQNLLHLSAQQRRGGGGGGDKIFLILWDENVFNIWSLYIVHELCESRDGSPGLSILMNLTVSMDVSNTELCLSTGHSLSLICQPTSEDMKLYIIMMIPLIINASNKGELCQCMSHCSCTSLKCGIQFKTWGCLVLLYYNWWCLCFGGRKEHTCEILLQKCMLACTWASLISTSFI